MGGEWGGAEGGVYKGVYSRVMSAALPKRAGERRSKGGRRSCVVLFFRREQCVKYIKIWGVASVNDRVEIGTG